MAKTITITISDAEFVNLQKAFVKTSSPGIDGSIEESSITEDYIKNKLIAVLKSRMAQYDEIKARATTTSTSFSPS